MTQSIMKAIRQDRWIIINERHVNVITQILIYLDQLL